MANRRKRFYDPGTEVARVVEAVGGLRWAAAHCEVSHESVMQWLLAGYVPTGKYAVLLAEAAQAFGFMANLRRLVGLETQEVAPPNGGNGGGNGAEPGTGGPRPLAPPSRSSQVSAQSRAQVFDKAA